MGEVLLTNIFFVITSVAVVLVTLVVCAILYQALKISQAIRRILERIDAGTEGIVEDVTALRRSLSGGGIVGRVISGIFLRHSDKDENEEPRRTKRKTARKSERKR